jgi:hypothetical protein
MVGPLVGGNPGLQLLPRSTKHQESTAGVRDEAEVVYAYIVPHPIQSGCFDCECLRLTIGIGDGRRPLSVGLLFIIRLFPDRQPRACR